MKDRAVTHPGTTTATNIKSSTGNLEHFHFYPEQDRAAKCGVSWGKAASKMRSLSEAPEVKML